MLGTDTEFFQRGTKKVFSEKIIIEWKREEKVWDPALWISEGLAFWPEEIANAMIFRQAWVWGQCDWISVI